MGTGPLLKYRPERAEISYVRLFLQRLRTPAGRGRAACAVLTALLSPLALGACGSSASSGANAVTRAAYTSTREAGMRFTLNLHLSRSSPAQSFSVTGSGYAGPGGHSASMSMDFSGIPGAGGLVSHGHGVQAVYMYPTVYLRMPFIADKLPEGKSWLEIELSKVLSAPHGGSAPQAFGIGQIDPTQLLDYLKASVGQVRDLGTQRLYGTLTTHYRVQPRLASVLAKLPAGSRAAARALLEHAGNAGAVPFDVWVDGRGRVRQIQISLAIQGPTATGLATVTIGFTAYGPVPAVTPPPADEVVNLTGMLSSGLLSSLAG